MQPLYGFISDKLGLKKNILFMISLLLVFTGPFYIFVYGPLLQYNVPCSSIFKLIFAADLFNKGFNRADSCEKSSSQINSADGSLGWAAATFFAGQLFNIDPNINFWVASVSAVILVAIIVSVKIEIVTPITYNIKNQKSFKRKSPPTSFNPTESALSFS